MIRFALMAGLGILLIREGAELDHDRRVLKSHSGYQTVSMLDGGRTGLYFDVGEEAGKLRPDADRVVLLGLGGGEMLRAARRSLPTAELIGVEVDPHTAALAISDFGVLEFGVKVVVDDAYRYMRNPGLIDILMVDVFDDAHVPPKFKEDWFWRQCHEWVRPEGLVVMNVYPPSEAPDLMLTMNRAGFRKVWKRGLMEGNVLVFAEP